MNGGGQMQGQGEAIVPIRPGNPNTSLDRSAIQDHEAQDNFNCGIAHGIWELDQRYRQFASSPIASSDTVFTDGLATVVVTHCLVGTDLVQGWTA
jgi:hypothetical protein